MSVMIDAVTSAVANDDGGYDDYIDDDVVHVGCSWYQRTEGRQRRLRTTWRGRTNGQ